MQERREQQDHFEICSQCTLNCCRHARPPITVQRKQLIETYVQQRKRTSETLFQQTDYMFPREDDDGYCIFFQRKNRVCTIQQVKPETCVAGPITFDINTKTQRIEWYLKTEETCPLAGLLHSNEERLAQHLQSIKGEVLCLVNELDPKALRSILKIEEPKTVKIGEEVVQEIVIKKLLRDS